MNAGKSRLTKLGIALALPILLFAFASGPDPASNGDPLGSPQSCAQTACHIGTAVNGGPGSIAMTSSAGTAYAPGVQQTLTLRITLATARVYGYQISALTTDNKQAGTFTRGTGQLILCQNGQTRSTSTNACPASAPVEYIEHSNPSSSGTITVLWTPPATAVGNITLYYAGNAANGNGSADRGDQIYTGRLTLTGASAAPKPRISAIISAGAYGAFTTFTGGSWLEIYGTGLSATTRQWGGNDFRGSNAPTSLDNVSVTVNGRPAFVWVLVSGGANGDQLNVQAPTDGAISGDAQIVVTLNGQSSDPFTLVQDARLNPGLLAPPTYKIGGKQYIVGLFQDGATYACPPGSIAGLTCRLPKPGDILTFYGIGFGATQNSIPAGFIAPVGSNLLNAVTWQYGGTNATVQFAGLTPGSIGLYQFNIVTPNVAAAEYAVTVRVGGVAVPQVFSLQIGQ